jgi:hypothetical protein
MWGGHSPLAMDDTPRVTGVHRPSHSAAIRLSGAAEVTPREPLAGGPSVSSMGGSGVWGLPQQPVSSSGLGFVAGPAMLSGSGADYGGSGWWTPGPTAS